MNLVGIRAALVAQLHNNWTHSDVNVHYENVESLDLAREGEAFLRCDVLFDDAVQANIAAAPFHRIYGTLQIQVYVKASRGTVTLLSFLDELSDMFKFKNLGGVHTQAPRVGWEQKRDGWYSKDLRVSFYADSNT